MLQTAIGFTLGALVFQHLSALPSPWWLLLLPGVMLGWRKFPAFHLLPALVLGVLWSLAFAWISKPAEIPSRLLGQDVQIVGHIERIPKDRPRSSSFLFRASQLTHAEHRYQGDWMFRLGWYEDPPELILEFITQR